MRIPYFRVFLILFISLGLIYAQVRYEGLNRKHPTLQEQQRESIIVEHLVVTNHIWGAWKNGTILRIKLIKFNCNNSEVDSTLWVNGSAMTGIQVTYWWLINSVLLINWTYGWI